MPVSAPVAVRRRILVVDDDPHCRAAVAWLLSEEGYEAVVAGDGEEATELLSSCQPDLVVTDLEMPRLDGRGLLERVRRLRPGVPVLVLSARTDLEVEPVSDGCLSKPVQINVLLARIRDLVGS